MTTNDITSVAPVVRKAADGSVIPAVKAVQVHKAFGRCMCSRASI